MFLANRLDCHVAALLAMTGCLLAPHPKTKVSGYFLDGQRGA